MSKNKSKKRNTQGIKTHQKQNSNTKRITNKQRAEYDEMRQIDWEYLSPSYWDY